MTQRLSSASFWTTPWAVLALVNFAVWVALQIPSVSSEWFALGSPARIAAEPWTPVAYMFAQVKISHWISNMIFLCVGGSMVVRFGSAGLLYTLYFVGGLVGAAFFIAASAATGASDATLIGSSASVGAVCTAALFLWHSYCELGATGKSLLLLMAVFLVAVALNGFFEGNPGGSFAHIGGMAVGAAFGIWLQGRYRAARVLTQAERRRVTEKMKTSGYSSLSADERRTLTRSGK